VKERFIFAIGSDPKTTAPMLVRARVTSGGAKLVFTNRTSLAFGCRSKHDAEAVHWAPESAWDAYVANQQERIDRAKEQMAKAEQNIAQASVKRIVAAVDDSPSWG
jgi:hypothetical protein